MVTVSANVLVWVGSVLLAFVGSIGSIACHMFIRMDKNITELKLSDMEFKTKMIGRVETLERHDQRGQEESNGLLAYLKGMNENANRE